MYQGYGSASNYGSNHRAQQSTNLSYGRNHGYGPTVQSEPQTNSNYDLTIDLLRHATLEALLNSGNEEISRIYAEAEEAPELRKQVIKLETQVDVLKALQKDQAIMMMNMNMNNNTAAAANPLPVLETQVKLQNREVALRAAFPMAFNQAITVTSKQHDEYPEVTFWLHDEWSTYKKKRNTGSRYRFLQDKDGEEITEARLNEIRAFLLGAFNELQELLGDNKALPQTWANATKGRAVINACHSELHSTVPAKRAVPSESSKRSIKKIKVKQERFKIPEIRDPFASMDTNTTPTNNQVTSINNVAPASVSSFNQASSTAFDTNTMPAASSSGSSPDLESGAFQFNVPSMVLSTSNTIPTIPSMPSGVPVPSALTNNSSGPTPNAQPLNSESASNAVKPTPATPDIHSIQAPSALDTSSTSGSGAQPSLSTGATAKEASKSGTLPNQEANNVVKPSHLLSVPFVQAPQGQQVIKLTGPLPPQQPSTENPATKGGKKRGRKPTDVEIDPNTTNPKELFGLVWLSSLEPNAPRSMMALNAAWKALGESGKKPYKEQSKGLISERKGKGKAVVEEGEAAE
ncbi:hypothetical protein M378DRAFT_201167 [Amanita muscaria Koide BX008]|uniref:Uncharacterized protein n=1 Tax=Amanita muscaria (strain Koide BX008) TaxID=946122 RepID=A0A0C2RWC9_AMAMK|nr:hypothetical protein M378DRAFT_201167 [Amanita muscaria Koide BX008]